MTNITQKIFHPTALKTNVFQQWPEVFTSSHGLKFQVLSAANSSAEADFSENWPSEIALTCQLAELIALKEMPRRDVHSTSMYHQVEGWGASMDDLGGSWEDTRKSYQTSVLDPLFLPKIPVLQRNEAPRKSLNWLIKKSYSDPLKCTGVSY